jgi:hypothetical protein
MPKLKHGVRVVSGLALDDCHILGDRWEGAQWSDDLAESWVLHLQQAQITSHKANAGWLTGLWRSSTGVVVASDTTPAASDIVRAVSTNKQAAAKALEAAEKTENGTGRLAAAHTSPNGLGSEKMILTRSRALRGKQGYMTPYEAAEVIRDFLYDYIRSNKYFSSDKVAAALAKDWQDEEALEDRVLDFERAVPKLRDNDISLLFVCGILHPEDSPEVQAAVKQSVEALYTAYPEFRAFKTEITIYCRSGI